MGELARMASSKFLIVVFSLLPSLILSTRNVYIVRVHNDLKPSIFPSLESWYTSTLHTLSSFSTNTIEANSSTLDPRGNARLLHVYRTVFHGFSAILTPDEADLLHNDPSILSVIPDRARQLQTTRTPQFLGLVPSSTSNPNKLISNSDGGAGIVVAMLDTGINPSHRSFAPSADLPRPPERWNGTCQAGPSFPSTSCNNKIIGARFFMSGYDAYLRSHNMSISNTKNILSPFDSNGHGTHTASTVSGNSIKGASFLGLASGTASGIAPRAHIAIYKVCWSGGCYDSDILAGFDHAVSDGADIISISVGTGFPTSYEYDPIAMGAFSAVAVHGLLVSAATGNYGPIQSTASNSAPWITTVGASTIDRSFSSDVILGDDDNATTLSGVSLYIGKNISPKRWFPLVYAGNVSNPRSGWKASAAPNCMEGTLDPKAVQGKVVLCDQGWVSWAEKGLAVKEAGGAGMIIANELQSGEGVTPNPHLLPAVEVAYSVGETIRGYISTRARPRVRLLFHGTQLGVKPAPAIAAFSGRGPGESDFIIKPDLVAPGVGILAAWTNTVGPTRLPSDPRRTEFNILSGTSMSCPHVSGVAALLKSMHPDWSPAAIRSAMMTTAYVTNNLSQDLTDESNRNRTNEWSYGSGHIDPEKAADPGLIYDISEDDYLSFLCNSNYTEKNIQTITHSSVNCSGKTGNPWGLNYPSILAMLYQPVASTRKDKLETTVHRTLSSVEDGESTYIVSIKKPSGVQMVVEPRKIMFKGKGDKQKFVVRISASTMKLKAWGSHTEFGYIMWSDGKNRVRSPVGVIWKQLA
ncbi:hypothetical protein LUZ60_011438 [Juncus effusus]|nr:hypothetical protein LUZ60_011438 [Juncus effusus]